MRRELIRVNNLIRLIVWSLFENEFELKNKRYELLANSTE